MNEIPNNKSQINHNARNSKHVLVIVYCYLRFFCVLVFVIWKLTRARPRKAEVRWEVTRYNVEDEYEDDDSKR